MKEKRWYKPRHWRKDFYSLHKSMVKACEMHPEFMPLVQDLLLNNKYYLSKSVDNPLCVSYAKVDIKGEVVGDKYSPDSRLRTSLGRFLSRKLNFDGRSTGFVNRVITIDCMENHYNDFRILKGDDIVEAYRTEVGGHTCMTGNDCEYTRLYAENQDKVSLLVYEDPTSGLSARALLWVSDDGEKYMDRIYPDDGGLAIDLFRDWALINGYHRRYNQGAPAPNKTFTNRIVDSDTLVATSMSVTLKVEPHGRFPFMDTFSWGTFVPGSEYVTMQSSLAPSYENSDDFMEFMSVSGNYYPVSEVLCVECLQRFDEDSLFEIEDNKRVCTDCHGEMYKSCDVCGDNTRVESMIYVDNYEYHVCESCFERRFTPCGHCDETVLNDDILHAIDCDGSQILICNGCYDEHYTSCNHCCELVDVEFTVETATGNTVCRQCYEDLGYAECCKCGDNHLATDMIPQSHTDRLLCVECHDLEVERANEERRDVA